MKSTFCIELHVRGKNRYNYSIILFYLLVIALLLKITQTIIPVAKFKITIINKIICIFKLYCAD